MKAVELLAVLEGRKELALDFSGARKALQSYIALVVEPKLGEQLYIRNDTENQFSEKVWIEADRGAEPTLIAVTYPAVRIRDSLFNSNFAVNRLLIFNLPRKANDLSSRITGLRRNVQREFENAAGFCCSCPPRPVSLLIACPFHMPVTLLLP